MFFMLRQKEKSSVITELLIKNTFIYQSKSLNLD